MMSSKKRRPRTVLSSFLSTIVLLIVIKTKVCCSFQSSFRLFHVPRLSSPSSIIINPQHHRRRSRQPSPLIPLIPTTPHHLSSTELPSTTQPSPPTTSTTTTSASSIPTGAWIPIASASSIAPLGPTPLTVMNQRLVVWQSPLTNEWSVLYDSCPHKRAPLSQGRIDDVSGCIECPYHGWQFDDEGAVTNLPQSDVNETMMSSSRSSRLNARSLPVHLAGDLVFAFFPSSLHGESLPITTPPTHLFPYLADQIAANKTYFMRELPYSFDFLVENFMDPAHIPFAHHGLQSTREDGVPIPMTLVVDNETHVEVSFVDVSRGRTRDGILSFRRPVYYHFRTRKDGEGEYEPNLTIYCVPVSEGRSRVFLPDFGPRWIPSWLAHGGSNRFLNTDTWLHDVERNVRLHSHSDDDDEVVDELSLYSLPTTSDAGTRYFRKWWKKWGMATAPPHTFGPASRRELRLVSHLSRREQIDPWVSHTKTCARCRKGLRRLKLVRMGFVLSTTVGSLLVSRRGGGAVGLLSAVVMALSGFLVYGGIGRILTFIEGNPYPSGVEDRSVAAMKK